MANNKKVWTQDYVFAVTKEKAIPRGESGGERLDMNLLPYLNL